LYNIAVDSTKYFRRALPNWRSSCSLHRFRFNKILITKWNSKKWTYFSLL